FDQGSVAPSVSDEGITAAPWENKAHCRSGVQLCRMAVERSGHCDLRLLQGQDHRWATGVWWSVDAGRVNRGRSRVRSDREEVNQCCDVIDFGWSRQP